MGILKMELLKKSKIINYIKNWRDSYLIFKSGMFDANFYLDKNPDVSDKLSRGFFYNLSLNEKRIFRIIGKAMVHPIRHYVWHGAAEGRDPSASFITKYYLNRNIDVKNSEVNPLVHYVTNGKKEGRAPKQSYLDIMDHYGSLEDQIDLLKESIYFDAAYYLDSNPDVKESGLDPIEHYCMFGWKEKRNPSEIFNTREYTNRIKETIGEAEVNPLYFYHLLEREGLNLVDSKKAKYKRNKTILFVGHEAEQTGAPIILLDIIKWFEQHTAYKIKVVLLRGGRLTSKYEDTAETLVLDNLYDTNLAEKQIQEFIGDDHCLIFLNTVVAARVLEIIDFRKYPIIAYIHELEKTLRLFSGELQKLKIEANIIIGASKAVTDNLHYNHGFELGKLETIHAFINPQNQIFNVHDRRQKRFDLNISADKIVIFGCGSIYWRKNPTAFIDVAERVLKLTDIECEFIWIGEGEEMKRCEKLISSKNLNKNVKFIGSVDNPRDYFAVGDIFLLTAIEDPFPLVCLEAAECEIPIICFEDSGGMPIFVSDDAGIVVPYKDNQAMADAILDLVSNDTLRRELGATARKKVMGNYTLNKSVHKIKQMIDLKFQVVPSLSVIVPNYNHGKFLKQRLDSIYKQTFKDIEVILLDDVSTDNSIEILNSYHAENKHITRRIFNKVNSGSVFLQWKKGIEESKSDLIWIAESDDYSELNFIEEIITAFQNDEVVISYSNSNVIDTNGKFYTTYENSPWLRDLSTEKWSNSYTNKGIAEFAEALAIKCTIPNVSGVIFRKEFALKSLSFAEKYKKAGDWVFYAHMLRYGSIAYNCKSLNYHRRHEGTVTSKEGDEQGVMEIYEVHKHFVENFRITPDLRIRMLDFIKKEYSIYLERGSVKRKLKDLYDENYILNAPLVYKIALFQHGLNLGKGGAEKILIEKANLFYERGYEVNIYNRTNVSKELPYKLNTNIKVINVGLKEDLSPVLEGNKPDLAIVFSIGHPDVINIKQFNVLRIPVILTLHNQPAFFDSSPGRKEHFEALNLADTTVTLIQSYKRHYMERDIRLPIEVIPNFVEQPKLKGAFMGLSEKKYILNVGRLVKQKQQKLLINSFSKLASDYKNWNLVIAGEGNLRSELEALIREKNLDQRVTLLGEVDNIGDYYKNCDLFVLSSEFEGFSLAPIEAASFGKTVILFEDCPPYNEYFGENDKMIRVKEMNVKSLEKTLRICMGEDFISDENENIKFYDEFSPEVIIPKWEKLIDQVIKNNKIILEVEKNVE